MQLCVEKQEVKVAANVVWVRCRGGQASVSETFLLWGACTR